MLVRRLFVLMILLVFVLIYCSLFLIKDSNEEHVITPTKVVVVPTVEITTTSTAPAIVTTIISTSTSTSTTSTTIIRGDRCETSDPGLVNDPDPCGTGPEDARGFRNPVTGDCLVTDKGSGIGRGLILDESCPVNI